MSQYSNPDTAVKLVVCGFTAMEHLLLNGIVRVSQRRTPRIQLLEESGFQAADVIMVDARDPAAMRWVHQQAGLASKVVIWVDGSKPLHGHTQITRPVQWPMLPMLLARALENGPGPQQARDVPDRIEAQALSPAHPVQPKPLLIVDDSLTIRTHLRSVLKLIGFAVAEAGSGEEALAALESTDYACVLMDVTMPGMNGYEACRRIKARSGASGGPAVIMLTAKTSPFDHIRGKMVGCDAYLNKPVNPNELLTTLSRHVLPVASNRVIQRPVYHNTPGHQFVPS